MSALNDQACSSGEAPATPSEPRTDAKKEKTRRESTPIKVWVTTAEKANGILAYTVASDGALSPFFGSLVANVAGPLAVDPTGSFLYVAGSNLSGYAIGFNGP